MLINILKTLPWYFVGFAVLGVPAILLIVSLFVLPDSESFFFGSDWVANIFILITIISLFEFFNWLYKKSIRSRKSFFILLSYLIISIAIGIFGNEKNWYIVLAPISVFIANYFTYTKKRNLANILFYVFILTSLYYRCMIII